MNYSIIFGSGLALSLGLGASADVIGGKAVPISEVPWTAKNSTGCTGSWIGGKWGLTAKHCGTPAYLTLGITRKSQTNATYQVKVVRGITHASADINLLELEKVPAIATARPIRLATPGDSQYFAPGDTIRLSGWGRIKDGGASPDSVHMLDSPIAPASRQTATRIYYAGEKNGVMMGSCHGDSGGPLAVRDATGVWIQAGLVTGGSSVCGDVPPDYGPRLAAYDAWFKERMGGVVALNPLTDPANTLALHSGRLYLSRAQTLDITVRNLSGAVIWSRAGMYSAGENMLPWGSLGAVSAIVSIQGDNARLSQRLNLLR